MDVVSISYPVHTDNYPAARLSEALKVRAQNGLARYKRYTGIQPLRSPEI